MIIQQVANRFTVTRFKPLKPSKRPGLFKTIQRWGVKLNIRDAIDDNSSHILYITPELLYTIEKLVEFNASDEFIVYDHLLPVNDEQYVRSVIKIVYDKMAKEFEKRNRHIDFNGPLPPMSIKAEEGLTREILQSLRSFP